MLKQKLRNQLKQKYQESDIKQWFDPLHIIVTEQDPSQVEVIMPHTFFARWFFQNNQKDFEIAIASQIGPEVKIQYSVQSLRKKAPTAPHTYEINPVKITSSTHNPFAQAGFFFSNFFYNRKNNFPVAAAKNIAQGNTQQPLILYSQSGFGKTHLLHAIYHESEQLEDKKIIYFKTLEQLETIFKNNKKIGLADIAYFSGTRLFLLDDFQDCEGKPALQKRLCSLLEYFLSHQCRVCVGMDSHPDEYSYLNEKLRSLLQSFILAELKKPDLDIKIKFTEYLHNMYNLPVKKEDVFALARMYTHFREIQGAIAKIAAFKRLTPNDDQSLINILKNNKTPIEAIHPTHIIQRVSEFFGVTEEDVRGSSRKSDVVRARQFSMFLCRQMTDSPLAVIGSFYGRDHSSVLYSINKIKESIDSNKDAHKLSQKLRVLCTK